MKKGIMKKKMMSFLTMCMALAMLFGVSGHASAATKTQVKAAYKKQLVKMLPGNEWYYYNYLAFVDINRDGKKEMLANFTDLTCYGYSKGSVKIIGGDHNRHFDAFYYNKSKKILLGKTMYVNSRTGSYRYVQSYFKMSGGKLKRIKCINKKAIPSGYKKITFTKVRRKTINSFLNKY